MGDVGRNRDICPIMGVILGIVAVVKTQAYCSLVYMDF